MATKRITFKDAMGYDHSFAIQELSWPRILRAFRKKHKLTQKRLAELLPTTSKRNLQDWEQGIHMPPRYLKRALRDLERELQKRTSTND